MAKVILICGGLCSGKSTYAAKMRSECKAVLLSVDELMLAIFGGDAGEKHDEYTSRLQSYLYEKAAELAQDGHDVILDWGFWTKQSRADARGFFVLRGVECELHYIDVSDEEWRRRVQKRNAAVIDGSAQAYYVDDGLAEKFTRMFDRPTSDEIDVLVGQ